MRARPMCLAGLIAAIWVLLLAGSGKLPLPKAPPGLEGKRISLTGQVYRVEQKKASLWIYLNHISSKSFEPSQYQSNVAVMLKSEEKPAIGSLVLAGGVCQIPPEPTNPGEFDMASYYGNQGIGIQLMEGEIQVLKEGRQYLGQALNDLRESFQESLYRVLGERDGGLLGAMLLGEKSGLEEEVKALYQAGGISHILAISGLHISLIGMGLYRLFRRIFGGFLLPGAVSGACLLLYGVLIGMPVSAMRAIIMFFVYLGAQILGRTYDLLSALSLAGILILLREPRYLFQASFQLSFLSILGIGLVYPAMKPVGGRLPKWLDGLILSLSIQLITLPCTLYWFGQTSLFGPLFNLAVLPLAGLVMVSGFLGGAVGYIWIGGGMMAAAPCHYVLRFYEGLCVFAGRAGAGRGVWGAPKEWKIVLYYLVLVSAIGALFLLKERQKNRQGREQPGKKERLISIGVRLSATGICLGLMAAKLPGGLQMTFLDVGQGDGIFWQSGEGTTYLCDGGSSSVSQVGKYRLESFLKWKGVGRLDYLILTHMDADHINGAEYLLTPSPGGITVGCLVLPDIVTEDEDYATLVGLAKKAGTAVRYLSGGVVLRDGELEIQCLYPEKESRVGEEDRNTYSLVLQLVYGDFCALLTGDLEGEGERALLESGQLADADLLKVAHHGSKGSTSEEFLKQVRPEQAVLSYGEHNRYGHPHRELLERLKEAGCRIYETAEDGAITVQSDGEQYWIETYR